MRIHSCYASEGDLHTRVGDLHFRQATGVRAYPRGGACRHSCYIVNYAGQHEPSGVSGRKSRLIGVVGHCGGVDGRPESSEWRAWFPYTRYTSVPTPTVSSTMASAPGELAAAPARASAPVPVSVMIEPIPSLDAMISATPEPTPPVPVARMVH